ncbi:MAG: sodium:proton exchanger [Myxococcales bacterium FL481]|nr:MAG: sodium:proton exchanger [Myxococcales bacterium FL481]
MLNHTTVPQAQDWTLVIIGMFLVAGYAAHVIGRRTHIPRVTLLLLLGISAGPSGLGLLGEETAEWFPLVTQSALSLLGFMLGERFFGKKLRQTGRVILSVAIAESLGAALAVFFGLLLAGAPLVLALLLAGVAPASAPAATVDVISEARANGEVTETVLGVVAIDDAFGILLFGLLLAIAQAAAGDGLSWRTLAEGAWEVVGAGALGAAIGVPMAWITGRVRPGELTLLEALGAVLLCGGLASVIGVSYLLACMTLGAVVARRAHHHTRPLHAIEGVSQPLLVVFFVLAGLEFDLEAFLAFGATGIVYFLARVGGKLAGGFVGARIATAPAKVSTHVGWCLLPQAGVALGLGLVASQRFPTIGASVLSVLLGTTFLFEVFGPIATRLSLRHAGETGQAPSTTSGDPPNDQPHTFAG